MMNKTKAAMKLKLNAPFFEKKFYSRTLFLKQLETRLDSSD